MSSTYLSRLGLSLAAVTAIGACSADRDPPRIPLDRPRTASVGTSGAETRIGITGEAKIALDSGNTLFRAKAYERALAQYRRPAKLAPTELAPLFGILMVTDVTTAGLPPRPKRAEAFERLLYYVAGLNIPHIRLDRLM